MWRQESWNGKITNYYDTYIRFFVDKCRTMIDDLQMPIVVINSIKNLGSLINFKL